MQTSDSTRSVALLVPRLLGVQADPAEFETADALAEAVERAAEELLRWHDELADIRPCRVYDGSLALGGDAASDSPTRASRRLAEQVKSGVIPADPASIEIASTELRGIASTIRRVAGARDGDDPAGEHGRQIASALGELAGALSALAETLRVEMRRLAGGTSGGADQVLARVVRAEHAARVAAAATLRI
ncbi:hypothetical protein HJ588_13325 [Flexivirga sp. ID2601S]|uniref:Uncharacterized protein n=1 Tax=Flexivirga aerilata TaxID=1656889 RepID=A0A849ALR5_9MICO|nr:hypothetical protein [Flexivirga aerilata]NNG40248.1 hypothetical protein [Flexivirga aerilata]